MVQAEVCLPDSLTKHCPFCADTILPAGIKCRYCGEKFDPPSALAAITPDSTNDSSRHKTMIVMLITAVCSIPIFMLTLEAITRLGGGRGVPERLFVGGALAATVCAAIIGVVPISLILSALAITLIAFPVKADIFDHDPVQTHDIVMLVPALTLIAADFSLSMDIKNRQQICTTALSRRTCTSTQEDALLTAAVFGHHPTDGQFLLWEAGYMTATTAAWYGAPEKIRWLVPTIVGAYESYLIAHNITNGLRFQFPAIHF